MYRCKLCNETTLNSSKTKHHQSKKHRYYSNLILNRYVIENVEVIKFKDVFNPYFIEHTRNFIFFRIHITFKPHKYVHDLNHEISVSNNVIYKIETKNYITYKTESASDFLHQVILIYFFTSALEKFQK